MKNKRSCRRKKVWIQNWKGTKLHALQLSSHGGQTRIIAIAHSI